jgi:hypothetical protein
METKTNVFYVVAFTPIGIWTRLAPQNDHQHLSFVKDIYAVGKTMTRNSRKIAKCKGCDIWIWTDYNFELLHIFNEYILYKSFHNHNLLR